MRRLTYRQIADDLEARMDSDPPQYPPGAELPSYRELAEIYSVHPSTIAKSISLLRDRGRVYGHAGRATYVVDPSEQR